MKIRKLWLGFAIVVAASFAVLLYYGYEIYQVAPPIPEKVVTTDGEELFSSQDIKDGQNVWQSTGGQQLGSIWGHGAYQAPDWTADWLHREALVILDLISQEVYEQSYASLTPEQQAGVEVSLRRDMRANTYNPATGVLTISKYRKAAFESNSAHYGGLFTDDPELHDLREAYAIPANALKDSDRVDKLNAFFFWAAWSCITERPGKEITYTNNWPADELIGNTPSVDMVFWTGLSVIILLAGIAWMVWFYASRKEEEYEIPKEAPFDTSMKTPSQNATLKYFWVVLLLFLAQVVTGIITAHYGVEGHDFYGIPLSEWLPYSVSRTWHIQLAIFWIATAWLATGLYYAPTISGYEPKLQKLGVDFLFIALLIVVIGSMTGQWMGIMQKMGLSQNFWFGHQGYEYVDLGRFWQLLLFVGLLLWFFLIARAIVPAIKAKSQHKHILYMFLFASFAIAIFYGAGLMWGQQTHLSIAEYWRWWVVHLWVEGFFEVFAVAIMAFLFVKLKLVRVTTATNSVILSTTIFLTGGILGTFHHLYFSGTPLAVTAIGASFSALEVVPLVLMGYEAFDNLKALKGAKWASLYKWSLYSFIAVAFWNLVGAGLLGFLINPPLALYYMQGLNTTPAHGHGALFGVYGMLGIGLMLFVLRDMDLEVVWKDKILKFSFWALNIGLAGMLALSLLPIGIAQTIASVQEGLWYARSAEFLNLDYIVVLKWLRMIGDTIFALGAVGLAWFVLGLKFGWSIEKK